MTGTLDTEILNAIVPLRAAGFALHWLKPRKKAPIGANWSEAPVASIEDLRATHSRGNNLGLRLGEPSLLTHGGYLHVLDLDIRIPDQVDDAWAAVERLFPGIDVREFPTVISGSGGESRHIYFATSKPFNSKLLALSEGKHRRYAADRQKEVWSYDWEIELYGTLKQVVMPPSIHPDTGQPYRWEREFDFDGFAPFPTIDAAVIEALGAAETVEYAFETRAPLDFKPGQLERDLDVIPVSDLHYDDWVRLGQALHHQFGGSQEGFDLWLQHTKRSAKYVGEKQDREMRRIKWRSFGKYRGQPVTMGTVRAWAQDQRARTLADEFDDLDGDDVVSPPPSAERQAEFDRIAAEDKLHDDHLPPETLREALMRNPQGRDLSQYTEEELNTVIHEAGPLWKPEAKDDFDDLLETAATIATEPAAEDEPWDGGELTEEERALTWTSLLALNDEGKVTGNLHNLRLIVEHDPRTKGVTAFNEFTQEVVQRASPGLKPQRKNAAKPTLQLEGSSWQLRDPVNGDFWTEDKDNAIRAIIEAPKTQGGYGIKGPDRDLRAAIDIVGRKNGFHPVREYLHDLRWDGTPRVESLFVDYVGAPNDAYHRHAARIMLVAAVARVHEPGAKFDTAVILEGLQGKRKSTFISVLAKNWFVELDVDVTDTQAVVELLQGAWIVELNELGGISKADVRHVKAFISRRSDKVRLAYAKRAQEFFRQSVLIGSTNDTVYLRDSTGGRRFLPVRCNLEGEIDTDRLATQIDQIWAEALHLYREMRASQPHGTLPLYLADPEARETAERLQESRLVESTEDAMVGRIAEWLSKPIMTGSLDDDFDEEGKPVYRNEVCLLEIWCECLGREEAQYIGIWPAALGRAMRQVPGWKESTRRPRFGKYGQQRAFERDGWVVAELGLAK